MSRPMAVRKAYKRGVQNAEHSIRRIQEHLDNALNVVLNQAGRITELEQQLAGRDAAICIHMREETMLELEDWEYDWEALATFLHGAAELEPDLSVANMLWSGAHALEQGAEGKQ